MRKQITSKYSKQYSRGLNKNNEEIVLYICNICGLQGCTNAVRCPICNFDIHPQCAFFILKERWPDLENKVNLEAKSNTKLIVKLGFNKVEENFKSKFVLENLQNKLKEEKENESRNVKLKKKKENKNNNNVNNNNLDKKEKIEKESNMPNHSTSISPYFYFFYFYSTSSLFFF